VGFLICGDALFEFEHAGDLAICFVPSGIVRKHGCIAVSARVLCPLLFLFKALVVRPDHDYWNWAVLKTIFRKRVARVDEPLDAAE